MSVNTRLGYFAGIAVAYLVGIAAYSRIPEPFCGPGCTMVSHGRSSRLPSRPPSLSSSSSSACCGSAIRFGIVMHTGIGVSRHYCDSYSLPARLACLHTVCPDISASSDIVKAVAHAVPVMFGLTLIVIGNLLPRFRPNVVIGIRTARTLNDRAAWAHTNRIAGYATVGAGVMFLLAGRIPSLPGHGIRDRCRARLW